MIKQLGYRGYISSRPVLGNRVPQHVQDIMIRDYCTANNMHYLSSATEYTMENCYVMLEQVLNEASKNHGVVLYSLFQLPQDSAKRQCLYNTVLEKQLEMHTAVEGLLIKDQDSVQRVEDIWLVHQTVNSQSSSVNAANNTTAKNSSGIFSGFLNYGRN